MKTDLRAIVGVEHVTEPTREELTDASHVMGLRGTAAATVRPGDAAEACAVVAWCYERGVPIVTRGGGTGYSGGSVPLDERAIVLALDRLDRVRSFEPGLWRAECEAGVRTQTLQRRAREHGVWFGVDPGAAEQSTLGGNVATNAGGPHCFKHGVMRAWVTGLEVVLAPGELVRVGGPMRKDVAGYDLVGLLCGSEGTLGVVTSVWCKLLPAPAVQLPVVGCFRDARSGQEGLESVLASGVTPAALEYLDAGTVWAAGGSFPGGLPHGTGFLLIAESDTTKSDADDLEAALVEAGATVLRPAARPLWAWRDAVGFGVVAARGGKLSEDVAIPVERLADAVEEIVALGARHGLQACSWGHAGDGNLHATFLLNPDDPADLPRAEAASQELFAMAIAMGGTVSGEHGLGWLKRGQLGRQWAPAAVRAHAALKATFDPAGLLNPGKKMA